MLTLDSTTIFFAGLLVGNEFAIAAFVHPTLSRLPKDVHIPSAVALARILGRFMPFWYAAVVLLSVAEASLRWHHTGRPSALLVSASVLLALSIVYTITALVPLNNRIASWMDTARSAEFVTARHRWDVLHRWRVLLLAIAFACLIAGLRC